MQFSRLFKTGALALVTSLALTGCEIDLSDSKDSPAAVTPQTRTLTGYVTDGAASGEGGVAGATIWVGDRNGKLVVKSTDANGSFTADITGFSAPVVVRASFTRQGENSPTVWYSLVENPSNNSVVGINSFTNVVLSYEILTAYGVLDNGQAPANRAVATATDSTELTAEQKLQALINAGVFSDISSGSLDLNDNMTRAQFAQVAARLFNLNNNPPATATFADVPAAAWYLSAITAAQIAGFAAPDLAGSAFSPSTDASRAQLASLLAQAAPFRLQPPANPGDWTAPHVAAAFSAAQSNPSLTDLADRRALLLSGDYSDFLRDLPNGLAFFKLQAPSSWNVEVHVQSNDIAPIDISRKVTYTGNSADIPLNEDQLLALLQKELQSRLPGRLEFTNLTLHAEGTGAVGSRLWSSAIQGKVTLAGQTRSFFIESFSAERVALPD